MSSMGEAERFVKIEAQPEQIEIDLAKTALIVVDMQNAFAGRGEDSNLPLQSIRRAKRAIKRTKRLVEASRAATIKVIYLAMIKNPERKSKSLIKSTRDTKIVDELTPLAGDVVVEKSCYSGFRGTKLDEVLKSYKIAYLIFTGIATNICVESTLRDAYFLDYLPILVSDATSNAGPLITQHATLWNVGEAFGWVATTEDVLTALSGK